MSARVRARRARKRCHWRVDFFSNQLSPPAVQETRRGLERFGGPVKTGRAGGWEGGACGLGAPLPRIVQPFGEKIAEEGGK